MKVSGLNLTLNLEVCVLKLMQDQVTLIKGTKSIKYNLNLNKDDA